MNLAIKETSVEKNINKIVVLKHINRSNNIKWIRLITLYLAETWKKP